jgi:hypothetical protein
MPRKKKKREDKKVEEKEEESLWKDNPIVHFTIALITTTLLIALLLVFTIEGFKVPDIMMFPIPLHETITTEIQGMACNFNGLCENGENPISCQPDCNSDSPKVGGRGLVTDWPVIQDWGPCCYPINCPQAKNNPPDCKCEFDVVWCGELNLTVNTSLLKPYTTKTGYPNQEWVGKE